MNHLSLGVFFVVFVQPHGGWSASCGKLARCGGADNVLGSFSNPFPHVRMGSAGMKKASHLPEMLPNASCAMGIELSDHWSKGHLDASCDYGC